MPKADIQPVDRYIASQPTSAQPVLELVRKAIRDALPRAEEVISYKMPTYKLQGEAVLYFAGWKHHYSLYPASQPLLQEFQRDLASCEINKSTIRFRLTEPIPVKLIARIARFRVKEIAERVKSKAAG